MGVFKKGKVWGTIKKQKILGIVMIILLLLLALICIYITWVPPANLRSIDISEIEKIKVSGFTGTKNGEFSYTLSKKECGEFVALLHQVELGGKVDKEQALSYGAVTYYTIYFFEDEPITISPGAYFVIEGKYYRFINYEKLWDKFIYFNSLR